MNICSNVAQVTYDKVNDVFPNGVASNPDWISIDRETGKVTPSSLASYVDLLTDNGTIPGREANASIQNEKDRAFYARIENEYCFYQVRYKTALSQFIAKVSEPNAATNAGNAELEVSKLLNKKLNILLEVMNYIGNQRAQNVNSRNSDMNLESSINNNIREQINTLKSQSELLNSSDVRTQTQLEMMHYSKEKNTAMNIQIMFFIALNVVALGTIFTVYKNLRTI
jgi:hypothetical protein